MVRAGRADEFKSNRQQNPFLIVEGVPVMPPRPPRRYDDRSGSPEWRGDDRPSRDRDSRDRDYRGRGDRYSRDRDDRPPRARQPFEDRSESACASWE